MKKTLAWLLLAAMVLSTLLMASCGSEETSESTPSQSASQDSSTTESSDTSEDTEEEIGRAHV